MKGLLFALSVLRLRFATLSTNGRPVGLSVRRSAPDAEGLYEIVNCFSVAGDTCHILTQFPCFTISVE